MNLNLFYKDKKQSYEAVEDEVGFEKFKEQAKSFLNANEGDISMSFTDIDGDQVPITDSDDYEYLLARIKENKECNKVVLQKLNGSEEEEPKEEPKEEKLESFFNVVDSQLQSFVNLSKMNSSKTSDKNTTFVNIDGDDNLDADFIKVNEANVSLKDKEVKDQQKEAEEKLKELKRIEEAEEAERKERERMEEQRRMEMALIEEAQRKAEEERIRYLAEEQARREKELAREQEEQKKKEEAARLIQENVRRVQEQKRLKEEAERMEKEMRELELKKEREEAESFAMEQKQAENINFIGDISEILPVKVEKPFESFQHLNFNKKQPEQVPQQLGFIESNNETMINESLDDIITKNRKIDNISAKLENLDESIDQKLALFKDELMNHIKANAMVKRKSSRKKSNLDVVHIGVRCKECGRENFKGRRYKCLIRHDYDLCEKCEDKAIHPHPMVRFTKRDLDKRGTTLYKLNNILEQGKNTKEAKVKENFLRVITKNQYDDAFYSSLVKKYQKFAMGDYVTEIIRIFD